MGKFYGRVQYNNYQWIINAIAALGNHSGCVQYFGYQWIIKVIAALGQRRGGVYPHPRCCGAFAFF